MAGFRWQFLIPAAVFLLLAGIFGTYLVEIGRGKDIAALPSALIDKKAPSFALPPIDGDGPGFASTDLAGKVALVNVWASWCPPCRAEQPMLMRLKSEGVPIYGINYKDKPADARAMLNDLGNPYTRIGADRTGRVAIDWGVYGYPETFVVDREGRVRYRHVGPITAQDIDRIFHPLLTRLSG
jgi:cytochrome c biogenesis protein CcmG/thiol:disulfide interchange protein DsbE